MVESLNYLLGRDKMIKDFKFFHGITIESNEIQGMVRRLRAHWQPEPIEQIYSYHSIDAERELTRMLSEEMSRAIDEEIINTLTRRINGGGNQGFEGPIQRFSDNSDYFNRWMGIGGQTA